MLPTRPIARAWMRKLLPEKPSLPYYLDVLLACAQKEEDRFFDDDEPWSLPISHQITENLDRTDLVQASMDTFIPSNNVGYKLLQKMGWRTGSGLGRDGSGMVEPIRAQLKEDVMGLGKKELEEEVAESATKRKALEIEKEQTVEEKRRKLDQHLEKEKIKEEVTEINKVFYCDICSKQYTQALQYDQHLSSYDHHHKKRLAEMNKQARAMKKGFGKKDNKKKKEERREQEMLKRITEEANRKAAAAAAASGPPRPSDSQQSSAGWAPVPVGAPPLPAGSPAPPPAPPMPQATDTAATTSHSSSPALPSGFKPVSFTSGGSTTSPPPSGGFQPLPPAGPAAPPATGGFQPVAFAPPAAGRFQSVPVSSPSGGFRPISLGAPPPPPPGNLPPPPLPHSRPPPPPSHPPPSHPPPPSQPPPPVTSEPAPPTLPPTGSGISFGLAKAPPKPPVRFSFGGKK